MAQVPCQPRRIARLLRSHCIAPGCWQQPEGQLLLPHNTRTELNAQSCDTRTELNEVKKFSRFQKSLITRLEDEIDNLNGSNDDLELQYQSALPSVIQATKAKRFLATISSQVQELRSTGDKLQEVL